MKLKIAILLMLAGSQALSQIPPGYYSAANGASGVVLKAVLNDIIDNHTAYSYSALWDMLKVTDRDPNNPSNVIGIYSQFSMNAAAEYANGAGWDREHVWAQSRGNLGTSPGPGTDLHHLRVEDVSTNSARGNRVFDNGGILFVDISGNYLGTTPATVGNAWTWEPGDNQKGDIARMLFYMAVRYEGEQGEVDLELTEQILGTADQQPLHGRLSTLLAWHILDPVSAEEINRNNLVYGYQNNRNPFIDHPEYVASIWGGTSGPTPFVFHDLSTANFSFTGFSLGAITTYPTSMAGYRFLSERTSPNYLDTTSLARDLAGNSDPNTSGSIRNEIGNGVSFLNAGSNNIGAIVVGVNSLGRENITVSFSVSQLSESTRVNGLILQYRVGNSGTFTNVSPGADFVTNGTLSTPIAYTNIALPAACNNQSEVEVRWVYYYVSGTGARDRIALDEILITSTGLPVLPTGFMSGDAVICGSGTSATISVAVSGGVGPFELIYSDGTSNNLISSYISGTPISVSPTTNTNYTIVSIDGSTLGHSGSATITIGGTASSSTTSVSAPAPFIWSANGVSYITSGTYMDTLVNLAGCDSVLTLILTILPSGTFVYHDLSSSDYSFLGFASGATTTYPVSMAGYSFTAERTASNYSDTSTINRVLVPSSSSITTGSIRNEIGNGLSLLNSGSNHIGTLVVGVNSVGRENLTVSYTATQLSDATRTNGLILQYRIGNSGAFTNVSPSAVYLSTATGSLAPPVTYSNLALPSACDNQAMLEIRWVYYNVTGSGARDRIALDDITISSTGISTVANMNITMFIEGYYISGSSPAEMVSAYYQNDINNGGTTAASTDVDFVTVELTDAGFLPVYTVTGMLQNDGSLSLTFDPSAIGGSYYLHVIQANTISLWSSSMLTISQNNVYDFSTNMNSAAGFNAMAALAPGLFGLYSGDLNKDGFIDGFDYAQFETEVNLSSFGSYFLAGDLNGDSFVDGFDYPLFDYNAYVGAFEQYP